MPSVGEQSDFANVKFPKHSTIKYETFVLRSEEDWIERYEPINRNQTMV